MQGCALQVKNLTFLFNFQNILGNCELLGFCLALNSIAFHMGWEECSILLLIDGICIKGVFCGGQNITRFFNDH